ncbi:YqgQ family protein [Bacillus sp. B15-48]|uniref:YqgQ family protein n=1 Tax=Bacillus sp. B15-48 TaxID=1548601 RepID=UPI00193F6374|nr:YqgQ family protein [Bacillus sp. B15-48]MBM4762288.1 DUF910 family protein [Bacillus sp. B15-48]
MKTIYDIQQLLKSYGTIIYLGNRLDDLEMMEMEIRDLYHTQLLDESEFRTAILLLRREIRLEKEKRER